jgi:hypothetical protein
MMKMLKVVQILSLQLTSTMPKHLNTERNGKNWKDASVYIYILPRSHNILLFFLVKAKYGSDYDPDASDSEFSTDSESAESEDEDGEELTPVVDAAILRTLARIRKKDPAIYDSEKNIYGGERLPYMLWLQTN